MVNTYYQSYSYSRPSSLPFGKGKIVKIEKSLKDFARDINLTSISQIKLPKEAFNGSPNYKFLQEVKLQLVKPEKGVLPANHRALNLVVESKKYNEKSSDRTWLKTGDIQQIKDYLRQNGAENNIKSEVSNLLKEAFED